MRQPHCRQAMYNDCQGTQERIYTCHEFKYHSILLSIKNLRYTYQNKKNFAMGLYYR